MVANWSKMVIFRQKTSLNTIEENVPDTDDRIWYRNYDKWQNKTKNCFRNQKSRFNCFRFKIPNAHFVLEISFFVLVADEFIAIIESCVWVLKAHRILKITLKLDSKRFDIFTLQYFKIHWHFGDDKIKGPSNRVSKIDSIWRIFFPFEFSK